MSLSSTCISWQSLPHTSPRLYVTGDMQSHENQMPHNKRKAITLEDCKRLYELTSCCIHCVFYRGNYTSIFLSFTLISNWTRISVYYHNSWIIGKNACWLSMYKRKKKKVCLFLSSSAKQSHILSDSQKSTWFLPTVSNMSGYSCHLFSASNENNWEAQCDCDLITCTHSSITMPNFSDVRRKKL